MLENVDWLTFVNVLTCPMWCVRRWMNACVTHWYSKIGILCFSDSSLCDYAYTHECLKLKEPIRFSLHLVNDLNKPFLRKPGDDEEPIYMIKVCEISSVYYFKNILSQNHFCVLYWAVNFCSNWVADIV